MLVGDNDQGKLPGVDSEITAIREALLQQFGNSIDVQTPVVRFEMFDEALASGSFDVIHYAGHASFAPLEPENSALLIAGNRFLAQRIAERTRGSPMVFLNACGTGAARPSGEDDARVVRSAKGLASAFLEGGALGCIGNLWPVNDGAAAAFAIDVYNHLIEGATLGKSILAARQAARKHRDRSTWASFVLFGNPLFRLN